MSSSKIKVSKHTYFVYCATASLFAELEHENNLARESAALCNGRWMPVPCLLVPEAVWILGVFPLASCRYIIDLDKYLRQGLGS